MAPDCHAVPGGRSAAKLADPPPAVVVVTRYATTVTGRSPGFAVGTGAGEQVGVAGEEGGAVVAQPGGREVDETGQMLERDVGVPPGLLVAEVAENPEAAKKTRRRKVLAHSHQEVVVKAGVDESDHLLARRMGRVERRGRDRQVQPQADVVQNDVDHDPRAQVSDLRVGVAGLVRIPEERATPGEPVRRLLKEGEAAPRFRLEDLDMIWLTSHATEG